MIIKINRKNIELYKKALQEKNLIIAASCFDKISDGIGTYFGVNMNKSLNASVSGVLFETAKVSGDMVELSSISNINDLFSSDDKLIASTKGFVSAMSEFISKRMRNGWFFIYSVEFNCHLPFLLTECRFVAAPTKNDESIVIINLAYFSAQNKSKWEKGNVKNITRKLSKDNIVGKSIPEILMGLNMIPETDELINSYRVSMKLYNDIVCERGRLFKNKTFSNKSNNNEDDLVINDEYDVDDVVVVSSVHSSFLSEILREPSNNAPRSSDIFSKIKKGESEETYIPKEFIEFFKKDAVFELPFHHIIKTFSITNHKEIFVSSEKLEYYKYDQEIRSKIILPSTHKELVDILVSSDLDVMSDIVKNKSGGRSILCKGPAGVGKTLTAQVYSEVCQKPLYSVQCGQLGILPDQIESNLKTIFERAERWKCILLIDEADIYIRKRDNDIHHNAIVATILRMLEAYKGILFMTTNRSDDIDDAVLSRCMAIINYSKPKEEELRLLWPVLCNNYGINIDSVPNLINDLISTFDGVTGRDIKELLKLVVEYKNNRGVAVSIELFKKCAIFRGINTKQ